MKKRYMTPDLEPIKLTLYDVILMSPTEGDVPINYDDPELPTEEGEGLDL